MNISYFETKFLLNLNTDNDATNRLDFLHQRKLILYRKTPEQPRQNGSEIKIQIIV